MRECATKDIVLVQLNPTDRAELPISARDILDRLNEVTMNAALMRELEGIATINKLLAAGQLQHPRYELIHLHLIADPAVMAGLGMRSKNNTAWPFLTYLRDAGRAAADRWLTEHRHQLGRELTHGSGRVRRLSRPVGKARGSKAAPGFRLVNRGSTRPVTFRPASSRC